MWGVDRLCACLVALPESGEEPLELSQALWRRIDEDVLAQVGQILL
jgi:hypothetical protein